MWGGALESETGGTAPAAASWGSAVGGATGGETAAWMATASGGQAGWGGNSGALPAAKGGWDTQQQSNLVSPCGASGQSSGSSWQGASNGVTPVNGWTGGSGASTSWNTVSGQQWTGTSPGSGSTWAGVAGRHAPTTASTIPQTPVQQGSGSSNGPVVTTPTAVAVRPKAASSSFEGVGASGTVAWGKPIDQGTPWEVRQEGANCAISGGPASGAPGVQWGGGSGPNWNAGGSQNSSSGGNMSRENSWQNAGADNRDSTPSYVGYGGGGGMKAVRGVSNSGPNETPQWGATHGNVGGGSGWDAPPAQTRHSSSGMWNASGGVSAPQQEPAANVWTGPPPPQDVADNNMIWRNPYPRKATQPDKGTTAWGDPTTQGDIKRWKTNTEGDLLPALTALQASNPSNAQQAQSGAGAGSDNSGTPQSQPQTPISVGGAWKDSSTPTPQQQQPPKTPSWNTSGDNVGQGMTGASVSSPTSGGSGWGDQIPTPQGQSGNGTSLKRAYDRDGISTAGWGAKADDASRNSTESDGGNVSDDVFSSNPTTPLSAGAGPPGQPGSTLILSKQQQLPNGLGPHSIPGNNQGLNQLVAQMTNAKLSAQNAQMQNLSYNANASSMANNNAGRAQHLLTQQIADQIKVAVQARLIDPSILHQPLPQETLLRINQLLQCVPKLDQAQKELLQLQAQAANNQPQGLNAAQQQEYQRISNEVKQLRQTMANLKQAISAQTQSANGTGNQQVRNGTGNAATGTNGDGGQSKLEQWKRGSTNGMNGENAGNTSGSAVFSLGNVNDPWSNTPAKRNSGADWPQSSTPSGDMPKSPDKQMDTNKDIDGQQQLSGDGDNASTPGNAPGSGTVSSSGASAGGLATPTLLDDVPEFKPGQPWNWRDPKELAEDPDATPGSMKRPTLLNSVNSIVNSSDIFGGGTTAISGGSSGSDLMGAAALAMNAMNFGGNNTAMMGSGGYPNFGTSGVMPSSFYGHPKAGVGGFDLAKMPGHTGFGGQQQQGGLGDSWPPAAGGMPRASRPPSQLGQPVGGRAPYKQSMSTPSTAAGFMPPYNMGAAAPVQWVVLTNLNMIDESSLQMMMSRIAPVSACIYPPGAGFAVVKFKDVSLEKVLPTLQQECSAVGLTIQLAKDDEVSRLIQAVTGQRAGGGPPGGPRGTGAGHVFGPPPPPPPHHPGAMGPALWDPPPPHAAGPWGPPPAGAGMHHHGAGGPFGPHHAALTDPSVAAAMSLGMPPGMHDGLFPPVGHDRHAPF